MAFTLTGSLIKTAATLKNIPEERRQRKLDPIEAQRKELRKLLHKAKGTAIGQAYHFDDILKTPHLEEAFRQNVPVFDYKRMHDAWWHRILKGEPNVTWPEKIRYFSMSSGTSETASKYIPFTPELKAAITRASIRQFVSTVRYHFPAHFYSRNMLMVGASTALTYHPEGDFYAGYLSGISARRMPSWFEGFYNPGQRISSIEDWSERVNAIVASAPQWDVGAVVGLPSWVQLILEQIIEKYQLKTIHDLWPNLRVFLHSGMSFDSYEKSFQRIFGKPVYLVESYLASEGYIAYQVDLNRRVMQLLVDNGIYFEFIPFNDQNFNENGDVVAHPETLTLSEVQTGVDYALLLSTCAGSWRYLIGDTIRFLDKEACDIVITGRTKQFLSMTGEHLSQDNLTQAVEKLAEELGVTITEFTVAGVRHGSLYAHHWYLGCDDPIDPQQAIQRIDAYLCALNDDYAVERSEAIRELYIDVLPTHVFYAFMEEKIGKWGGATKFPRVLKGDRYALWHEYVHAAQP